MPKAPKIPARHARIAPTARPPKPPATDSPPADEHSGPVSASASASNPAPAITLKETLSLFTNLWDIAVTALPRTPIKEIKKEKGDNDDNDDEDEDGDGLPATIYTVVGDANPHATPGALPSGTEYKVERAITMWQLCDYSCLILYKEVGEQCKRKFYYLDLVPLSVRRWLIYRFRLRCHREVDSCLAACRLLGHPRGWPGDGRRTLSP